MARSSDLGWIHRQPGKDLGVLVGAVVVHDQVNVQHLRDGIFDQP
jgi:hypothetical protein